MTLWWKFRQRPSISSSQLTGFDKRERTSWEMAASCRKCLGLSCQPCDALCCVRFRLDFPIFSSTLIEAERTMNPTATCAKFRRHCSTAEFPYCIAYSLGHLLLAAGCVLLFAFGSTLRTLLSPADGPHPLQFVAINFVAMILPPPAPSSAPCHSSSPALVPVPLPAYLSNSPRYCRCHSCLRLAPASYLLPPAPGTSCFHSLIPRSRVVLPGLLFATTAAPQKFRIVGVMISMRAAEWQSQRQQIPKSPTYRTLPHRHPADPQATDPANPPADAVDAVHPINKRLQNNNMEYFLKYNLKKIL